MIKKFLLILLAFTGGKLPAQQIDLSYYLPQNVSYNKDIPTPAQVIGHEVGAWHITHDRLSWYMQTLAKISPRMTLVNRGKTYEDRPLWLLTVTSEDNHKVLDQIRMAHQSWSEDENFNGKVQDLPLVLYQGFSIHGNEPSGSNAALLYAYYLAAAEGPKIEKALSEGVILLDPSFNPDGLQRFSTWANSHKSQNINPDPNDREYREVWPGGRTNHYWFDLNRDWMPAQLPESQARIETFHQWRPNVLTDHHEMGTNSTFFFQPGIPSRTHPLTPKLNQELTKAIGGFHAKALDSIGSLYYSEEDYDDFYYGKGSTFPDIHGGIGILFEQASSRGHAQESDHGILTFPFTIKNQFNAALSTLKASISLRMELLNYQRLFYKKLRQNIGSEQVYLVQDENDPAKIKAFLTLLDRQKIQAFRLTETLRLGDQTFTPKNALAIPKDQTQSSLIEAMFERRTKFQDSLFYDISAWTMPYAFNFDYGSAKVKSLGLKVTAKDIETGSTGLQQAYAYTLAWEDYYAPKALDNLLNLGLRVKVATRPFQSKGQNFDYGTLMIPGYNQNKSPEEIHEIMNALAINHQITAISSGATSGMNLGSGDFKSVEKKNIGVFVGPGINPYDAGEIWHLLDTRYDIQVTKLDVSALGTKDLSRYTTLIMPSTWGAGPNTRAAEKLKSWVANGGHLIGFRSAAYWLNKHELIQLPLRSAEKTGAQATFEHRQRYRGAQVIGGAIFEAEIDRSHPVTFGYSKDKLPLFRNTTIFLKPDEQRANNPLKYSANPHLSGYISKENLSVLAGSSAFKTKRNGSGRVSYFTDNTNFRAFWYGTNKLMMNAIFFEDQM